MRWPACWCCWRWATASAASCCPWPSAIPTASPPGCRRASASRWPSTASKPNGPGAGRCCGWTTCASGVVTRRCGSAMPKSWSRSMRGCCRGARSPSCACVAWTSPWSATTAGAGRCAACPASSRKSTRCPRCNASASCRSRMPACMCARRRWGSRPACRASTCACRWPASACARARMPGSGPATGRSPRPSISIAGPGMARSTPACAMPTCARSPGCRGSPGWCRWPGVAGCRPGWACMAIASTACVRAPRWKAWCCRAHRSWPARRHRRAASARCRWTRAGAARCANGRRRPRACGSAAGGRRTYSTDWPWPAASVTACARRGSMPNPCWPCSRWAMPPRRGCGTGWRPHRRVRCSRRWPSAACAAGRSRRVRACAACISRRSATARACAACPAISSPMPAACGCGSIRRRRSPSIGPPASAWSTRSPWMAKRWPGMTPTAGPCKPLGWPSTAAT